MRQRTKIVCTLGPASQDLRTIRRLIEAGADVFRLNASHGSAAEHAARIRIIRRASRSLNQPVGILVDLPGPKLRLANLVEKERTLRKGETVLLTRPSRSTAGDLPLRNPEILKDIRPGHEIYLADGTVQMRAEKREPAGMRCRVQVGGVVRSGSGVNLPDTDLSGAVPTAADRGWIRFARTHGADWLAVSFVQKPDDLLAVRRLAGTGPRAPRLIAKIEKRRAVKYLDEIIAVTDGVMVARGDLGVETPLAEVPMVQKRIIALANAAGKPVITATQMLESMVEHPTPTRAEVADVANAILDGTDGVMLSAESAIGHYPVLAAATLHRVAVATEYQFPYAAAFRRLAEQDWSGSREAISFSTARLAQDSGAQAIVIDPEAATRGAEISRFRPRAPVLALCRSWEEACRQTLAWGVQPLVVPKLWKQAAKVIVRWLRQAGVPKRGIHLVVLQSAKGREYSGTDLLRVVRL